MKQAYLCAPCQKRSYTTIVSERVNDKGVLIDKVVCDLAQRYAEAERLDIEAVRVGSPGAISRMSGPARCVSGYTLESAKAAGS